ncbi:hypothetical protein MMC20_006228 [Loxospora ochrophaea]|nr:hypothetical protein [Loxospora ochrophaea]
MSISLGRILDHGSAKASPMISEMVDETVNDFDNSHPGRAAERSDQKDMYRMGKKQELKREFHPFAALSFIAVLQGTWEFLLVHGLVDGGLAGLFWSYLFTFIGLGLIVISLAEMASMAPTAGGQYHWVSEFSPRKVQKPLSYFIGWMSALSWQAGQASGPFVLGTLIQGLAVVNYPDYEPTNWQGTLIVFAVVIPIYILNVYFMDIIPIFNTVMFGIYVSGFLAIIIPLWILSPRNTAEVVFTQFSNSGGWSSTGLALMVGQISPIYASICSDAAAHISEEVYSASLTVPRTMVYSYAINGLMGFLTLITFLFALTDLDAALTDPSTYPFLWVFQNALPLPALNTLTAVLLILVFAGSVTFSISTSRQTWSFARDHGLPCSSWIARVEPKRELPVNAILLTCLCTCALSLINIGSSVAFNAIISLNLVSLMLTYSTSIGCVLLRRLRDPESLPRARWALGRWGIPINAGALAYSLFAFFWCFWPNTTPVDVTSFNWAVVIFVGVAVIAITCYILQGRHIYEGPVVLVKEVENEG